MPDHGAIFDGIPPMDRPEALGRYVAAATADCGPCTHGADPVRDHLPPRLSPAARAALLARLSVGESRYGQPLRMGWAPAPVELAQELLDAVAYATAAGITGPDLDALVILANAAVAGVLGKRHDP